MPRPRSKYDLLAQVFAAMEADAAAVAARPVARYDAWKHTVLGLLAVPAGGPRGGKYDPFEGGLLRNATAPTGDAKVRSLLACLCRAGRAEQDRAGGGSACPQPSSIHSFPCDSGACPL